MQDINMNITRLRIRATHLENRIVAIKEVERCIKFSQRAIGEHQDAIKVDDRGQAVRDDDDNGVGKLCTDRLLDGVIGCVVEVAGCLVGDDQVGAAQNSAGHTARRSSISAVEGKGRGYSELTQVADAVQRSDSILLAQSPCPA